MNMADPDQLSSSFESLLDRLRQQSANSPNAIPSASDQSTNQRHHQQNQAQSLQQPNELLRSFFNPPVTQASQSQSQPYGYQQKTSSSPIASPLPSSSHPRSGVASPLGPIPQNRTPAPSAEHANAEQRAASLLSLLKFPPSTSVSLPTTPAAQTKPWTSTIPNGAQNFQSQQNQNGHGRAISASDLVASFMGKQAISLSKSPPTTSHAQDNAEIKRDPAEPSLAAAPNPQEFLLQLLNRPKPAQDDALSSPQLAKNETPSEQHSLDAPMTNLTQTLAETSLQQSFPGQSQSNKPFPLATNGSRQTIGTDGDGHPVSSKAEQTTQQPPTSLFTYVNPFDQLAASSPRNRTPKIETPRSEAHASAGEATPGTDDGNKRKIKGSPDSAQVHSRRKSSPNEEDASSILSSPAMSLLPDGRSHLEALMGIGAPDKADTTKEPPAEVSTQQDKQTQEIPTEAQPNEAEMLKNMENEKGVATKELSKGREQPLHDTTVETKKEVGKDGDQDVLEEGIPNPVAEAVKNVVNHAAEGNLADSWESADGEDTPEKDEELIVRVYDFPMKPFVSITLKPIEIPRAIFRVDSVMDISRLKKDFEQIDRTLATSTNKFIVYALAKNGGFRIIRQADGRDKQVFRGIHDRIFNVSASTARSASPTFGTEAVLGTGLSGTIYWTLIRKPSEDCFDQDVESYGFILPPTPDAHASGGQLKTRAKTSSCHPEFFAIGRGKSIFIVWPLVARDDRYTKDSKKHRVVDSEKYFKERCLKINTGKAGKDFTFSEDDSAIVSLDKAGRVRVWDVQELLSEAYGDPKLVKMPVEVNTPLMTLMTAIPSEKAWPTSVLLVDKLRPYVKCTALRYLIVGMKQNHTLQLWDLGLGKAVQELNFPHDKESDAICSVAYDPASGIIVVGHPTRNSIYFIHLSAPKYNLSTMSQARYIQRVAQKDSSIPKPDATAIMSGLREYSFATKGQLRSLDVLSRPHPPVLTERDDPVLFELYCMHSRGVTCISIKKEDLGWSKDSRVLHPVNAVKEGVVEIEDLREIPAAISTEPSSSVNENDGATASPTALIAKPIPKEIVKKSVIGSARPNSAVNPQTVVIASTLARVESKTDAARTALINGTSEGSTKPEKSKRVRKDELASSVSKATDSPSYAIAARQGKSPLPRVPASPSKEGSRSTLPKPMSVVPEVPGGTANETEHSPVLPDAGSINLGISGNFLDKEMKKVEKAVSAEFSKVITRELGALYSRFDEDKRIQQATGDAKQDAVLRLISSTLSENVEKTLGRIINTNIQQVVLPSIADVTATAIDRRLAENLAQSLSQNIPRELKTVLPETISRAIQNPDVLRVVADSVSLKLAGHIENEFSTVLHNTISPAFKSLAIEAAKKIAGEVEHRTAEQLRRADVQRQSDSKKMDQLTNLIRGLSETVHTMASAQAEFQSEILKLQRQLQHQSVRDEDTPTPPTQEKSPEELEAEAIVQMLDDGRIEEGTVMWLQSGPRQPELFDRIFARQGPGFVRSLSPLVMLSVAAAITTSFDSFPIERLQWLETILLVMDPLHQEVREMVPKIMDVLIQRMEHMYMGLSESNAGDPVLKKLPALWRKAKQLKQAAERGY
ncbi:hypothetical protein FGG08_003028 [Glutinoglossum americanum]|uniref:EDC4-like protein pdc1 beta-propeller domain-containing protein n=1 Tax=Glutinoglossum americanum TaxID=1670608 RepID=A0A9P8I8K4_9PEZI|nr:hypothetical protein FGG08_003028 [Glutinoglossum americanum]